MPAQNLLNRRGGRRRKHPPVRFRGAAAASQPSPSPPHPVEQHASQEQPPQQIQQNPQSDMETDESGTDPEEFDEFVTVSLSELRNNVQCPICLGIIKKTRTVMGCLHRFCRECIDKSMRLGNNECPACRIHCASRRSLRDDLHFDAFVSSIYPDVDKYEEEELVLHEQEKAVNEQIQASIAEISLRQSEAIAKGRKTGRDTSGSTSRVAQARNSRKCCSRRSGQSVKFDDSSNENDGGNNNTPIFETQLEFNQRSSSGISPIKTPCIVDEEDIQDSAEYRSSPSLVNPDLFTWGRAGTRSHTRHGGSNSSKVIRSKRVQKLADYLADVQKYEHENVGPVITTHLQNGETLWFKDCITSNSNASVSKDVFESPPQIIKRFSDEFVLIEDLFKLHSVAKR